MRRKAFLSSIILLLLSAGIVFSATGSLDIKGYRVGPSSEAIEPFVRLSVTSATSSLDIISAVTGTDEFPGNELDLTNSMDNFLASERNLGQGVEIFSQHVAFSYRVTGNIAGKYTVSISFTSPFTYVKDGSEVGDITPDTVDFSFRLGNISYSFNNNLNHPGNTFRSSDNRYGFTIQKVTNTDNPPAVYGWIVGDDYTNTTLKDTFQFVISGSISSSTPPDDPTVITAVRRPSDSRAYMTGEYWMARGVVAIGISSEDYENATNGKYSTPVYIELRYDS